MDTTIVNSARHILLATADKSGICVFCLVVNIVN